MILKQLSAQGRLLVIDKDPTAIAAAQVALGDDPRTYIYSGSYARLDEIVARTGWQQPIDGILLDLGVSSPQLDDPARGFSFRQAGPLDMRMDPARGESAADWLAHAAEQEISAVLAEYGEERFQKRIARAIVKAREESPIDTTQRLAAIVAAAIPTREQGKDPATRSFQAIRIYINQELEDLHRCLGQVVEVLCVGGRLAVISFHSLEDRIVKNFMRKEARGDDFPEDFPVTADQLNPRLRLVGKAVRAGEAEVGANPRARSAVLRVAEKV